MKLLSECKYLDMSEIILGKEYFRAKPDRPFQCFTGDRALAAFWDHPRQGQPTPTWSGLAQRETRVLAFNIRSASSPLGDPNVVAPYAARAVGQNRRLWPAQGKEGSPPNA